MPSAGNLKDIYIEEIRDLWSANDQMQRIMHNMSQKAADKKLKDLLDRSVEGIAKHSETLRSVLESQGGRVAKEHCKGMEGLVAEAKKARYRRGCRGVRCAIWSSSLNISACLITAWQASARPPPTQPRWARKTMRAS